MLISYSFSHQVLDRDNGSLGPRTIQPDRLQTLTSGSYCEESGNHGVRCDCVVACTNRWVKNHQLTWMQDGVSRSNRSNSTNSAHTGNRGNDIWEGACSVQQLGGITSDMCGQDLNHSLSSGGFSNRNLGESEEGRARFWSMIDGGSGGR